MFTFGIQASNREQAIAQAVALIEFLGGNAPEVEQGDAAQPAGGKKGPGRPKKGDTVDPTPVQPATVAAPVSTVADPFGNPAPAPAPRVYTQHEMVKALQEVAAKRPGDTGVEDGYKRVGTIIASVNPAYQNVGQVKPEDYGAVIAKTGVVT